MDENKVQMNIVEWILRIFLLIVFGFIGLYIPHVPPVYMLPLLFIILLFLITYHIYREHEERIKKILESRLPARIFINDKNRLEEEMISIVNGSKKFIMATGSRTRVKKYLDAIEKRVKKDGIEYWRILLGNKLHHELHEHLIALYDDKKVHIRWNKKESFSFILLTENDVLLALSDPRPNIFSSALKISDPELARDYKDYVLILWGNSQDVNKEDIEKMCVECSVLCKN